MTAVSKDGLALEYAAPALRADRDVVLQAVQERGSALKYADEALKNEKDIVLAAVSKFGWALEYAPALRADRDVVLQALRASSQAVQEKAFVDAALEYADEALKMMIRTLSWRLFPKMVGP